jgi:hypothetical protein
LGSLVELASDLDSFNIEVPGTRNIDDGQSPKSTFTDYNTPPSEPFRLQPGNSSVYRSFMLTIWKVAEDYLFF